MNNSIDFTPWDNLLREYVDKQGLVNYLAWKREQPEQLTNWLSTISQLEIEANMSNSEQLALWINLYNAFTVAAILERYPIKSILPKIWGIPNWFAFLWFFQSRVHNVGGKFYSLGEIENNILRDKLQEPRIHFAIVCASIGCPLLRDGAYFPEQVEQQLDDDARRFINNVGKVCYDEESNILFCSKIFKWYRQDFLKVAPSIPEYIRPYLDSDLPIAASTPIKYLYYDWNINQRISS